MTDIQQAELHSYIAAVENIARSIHLYTRFAAIQEEAEWRARKRNLNEVEGDQEEREREGHRWSSRYKGEGDSYDATSLSYPLSKLPMHMYARVTILASRVDSKTDVNERPREADDIAG